MAPNYRRKCRLKSINPLTFGPLPTTFKPCRSTTASRSCAGATAQAELGGGEERIQRQHEAGKKTARERLELLLDPGSFVEIDRFVAHRCHDFGMDEQQVPGDGVVTGYGRIDGRLVYVFAQDFTVFGGSLSRGQRAEDLQGHGPGHEDGRARSSASTTPAARASRRGSSRWAATPTSSCATRWPRASSRRSRPSWAPARAARSTRRPSPTSSSWSRTPRYMFVTGPDVIKTVTHEEVTFEELGGAATHSAHLAAWPTSRPRARTTCLALIRELLSFLPSNNSTTRRVAPTRRSDRPRGRGASTVAGARSSPNKPYDMKELIRRGASTTALLRGPRRTSRRTSSSASRRLGGRPRGHRGQPAGGPGRRAWTSTPRSRPRASSASATASTSRSSPSRTCPGFLPGTAQEFGGIIKHGAKLLYAYCEATVPKLTVITRKAYGGAY